MTDGDGVRGHVGTTHRMLSTYLNAVLRAGLVFEDFMEPATHRAGVLRRPRPATRLTRRATTFVAVDWSGAKGTGRKPGIWITAGRGDAVVMRPRRMVAREAIDFVRVQPAPVVAGFDFSFGVPGVVRARARLHDDRRRLGARRARRRSVVGADRRRSGASAARSLRATVPRVRGATAPDGIAPKSIFQLVGNGQVGAGSVRGMPHLARLREPASRSGRSTTPAIASRSRSTRGCCASGSPHSTRRRAHDRHARDAVVSARVMWTTATRLRTLRAATDPVTRIEGDVWMPATSP